MTDGHICKECAFSKFPNGRAKIKAGTCYKIAGNDIMPVWILKETKACELFEKANKPKKKRCWKK